MKMDRITTPVKNLVRQVRSLNLRLPEDGALAQFLISRGSTVPPDAIPFQDPIDELCAEPPAKAMRSAHYYVAALFVTILLLSAIVQVDVVITGSGRLATETPPLMLQPLERSIIREMNVKPGEEVKKGQLLATLDPTFAQADLTSLSAQQRQLVAQLRRLEAEFAGTPLEAPQELSAESDLQMSLYKQREAQYESQIRVFDQEIQRRQANIHTIRDDRASQEKQLAVAKDIEQMRSSMLEKQVGSRLNFLNAQASRMQIEQVYESSTNRLVELEHELQAKQAEKQAFVDGWRNGILDQLIATRTEVTKISEGVAKASLLKTLVTVTAPEDGVVLDVAMRSVGSVVREAEPLITIIPAHTPLIAEIMVASGDVGYSKSGEEVLVKVDAFPYHRHGYLKGKLLYISEESFSNGGSLEQPAVSTRSSSGAFHRGVVELEDLALENLPDGARLIPGMTVIAEVKVGSRSVLSYFLTPITRGFSESIREP